MNLSSCSTLFCVFCLWTAAESTGTKAEKETKKVPGATATAMASKRRTSKRCVGSSRETQPAFWNLPREGANQSRRLIRRFYTQASVSKNCVDFPNVLDDNVFSSIFFISFFLIPFSSFSFSFLFFIKLWLFKNFSTILKFSDFYFYFFWGVVM